VHKPVMHLLKKEVTFITNSALCCKNTTYSTVTVREINLYSLGPTMIVVCIYHILYVVKDGPTRCWKSWAPLEPSFLQLQRSL